MQDKFREKKAKEGFQGKRFKRMTKRFEKKNDMKFEDL